MTVFKCKMCGGDLNVVEKAIIGTCEYCGSTMTLPTGADEQKTNLYNRANYFRRNNDFGRALDIYEDILNMDNTDAEAHWGIILCKYGIEYVEDPKTHERVPTCHRTQFDSIFVDADYMAAIENAEFAAREIYEAEARRIDEIQKSILTISKNEKPFDVFICYKETDDSGSRTKDSVLAQDIYYELIEKGYNIFFSRITLEDKLGKAYEPYIFAALNSARVMIVLGTKPEHFTAVWVKNEWSRYLALMKKEKDKTLIPAYRDMDPYELPDEFSNLQAQDMSKLGFVQDLLRGVEKIASGSEKQVSTNSTNMVDSISTASYEPLLKRAFLFLEDSNFTSANEYFERVLDQNPEESRAYIGNLLAELKMTNESQLQELEYSLTEFNNFNKALRFADEKQKTIYNGYNQKILDRIETGLVEFTEKKRIAAGIEALIVAGIVVFVFIISIIISMNS